MQEHAGQWNSACPAWQGNPFGAGYMGIAGSAMRQKAARYGHSPERRR